MAGARELDHDTGGLFGDGSMGLSSCSAYVMGPDYAGEIEQWIVDLPGRDGRLAAEYVQSDP